MTAQWHANTLEEAIREHWTPEILNTDQGSQFASEIFIQKALEREIRPSMDGKGRNIDNIFTERLWRSVKYEHVYLFPTSDGIECYQGIKKYFEYYSFERRHRSLDYQTPESFYPFQNENAA